jgi:hypothetical protein
MDGETHRLRDFLTRIAQQAGTPEGEEILARYGASEDDLPLLVDGDLVIRHARVEDVAQAWAHRRLAELRDGP